MRDLDANGTAHHIGSALVEANRFMPTLGSVPVNIQIVITTNSFNSTFLHSLGQHLPVSDVMAERLLSVGSVVRRYRGNILEVT